MKETLLTTLLPLALSVLSAAAVWALARLSTFLHAKATASKAYAALDRLSVTVSAVVADLNGTVVPKLREKAANGHLTAADIAELRVLALARLKVIWGEQGLKLLSDEAGILLPGLETLLSGLLEKHVALASAPVVLLPK